MLELLEKISISLGGLFVLLTLGLYLGCYSFLGLPTGVPSTDSVEFVRKVKEKSEAPKAPPSTASPPAPQPLDEEEKAVIQKLKEQDVKLTPGQRLQRKKLEVPSDLFEHVSHEGNWLRELKKAHSRPIATANGDTRLKLFNIAENSLFKSFGFQENDVIELIDGEILQFNEAKSHEYYSRAEQMIEKLRQGESISITVSRNNRPVHMQFQLENAR